MWLPKVPRPFGEPCLLAFPGSWRGNYLLGHNRGKAGSLSCAVSLMGKGEPVPTAWVGQQVVLVALKHGE